jgi:alpha-L-arabinofuranosidase
MKLWRDHYAPIRIGLDGDAKALNVVATKSEDGKTLYFKAVNPTNEPCRVTLNVDGANSGGANLDGGVKNATMKLITANGLRDRNTLDNPNAIAPKDGEVTINGQSVQFELPAYSTAVVTVE